MNRITPEALAELIQRHAQCVLDQKQKCPLVLFCKPMAWELNEFLGVGNDEGPRFPARHRDNGGEAAPAATRGVEMTKISAKAVTDGSTCLLTDEG